MAGLATAGSQRWLQLAVNTQPDLIDTPILSSLGGKGRPPLEWLCPVSAGGYPQYRDLQALQRLGVSAEIQHSLSAFWPRRGPAWDGLARTASGDLLLVEARASVAELASARSQAGPESFNRISDRLKTVREELAPRSTVDWTHTFYQYANRLAFLYFLRHLNDLPAHLVMIYFVNERDVNGPASRAGWEAALTLMHASMGLPRRHMLSPYIHNVFVDAGVVQRLAA